MRVLRDVVISRTDGTDVHAVSQIPAVVGEEMTLDVMGAGAALALRVRVLESRPLMVQGVVRHEVRLAMVNAGTEATVASRQPSESKTMNETVATVSEGASMEAV